MAPRRSRWRESVRPRRYSGENLEERLKICVFKGWSTVKALYRMSSVNLRPRLSVGDALPAALSVLTLGGKTRLLAGLAQGDRPLVLNFGSCT